MLQSAYIVNYLRLLLYWSVFFQERPFNFLKVIDTQNWVIQKNFSRPIYVVVGIDLLQKNFSFFTRKSELLYFPSNNIPITIYLANIIII